MEIDDILDDIGARTEMLQSNLGMMRRNFKMLNLYSIALSDLLIEKKIFTKEELNKLLDINIDNMTKFEQTLMKQSEEEVTNAFLEKLDEDKMVKA